MVCSVGRSGIYMAGESSITCYKADTLQQLEKISIEKNPSLPEQFLFLGHCLVVALDQDNALEGYSKQGEI